MLSKTHAKMTLRTDKLASLIKRELGRILLSEGYGESDGLLTITDVSVTADLSEAKVGISVIGRDARGVLKILNQNIYQIQGELNRHLVLRKFPRIIFAIDDRGQVAEKINKLIDASGT